MGDTLHTHVIETERCGSLNVYVQGDIEQARKGDKDGKPVFLTVHDIGKNHNSWLNFVYHPSMANIRERAVFVHVDLLGQEDDSEDLPDPHKFPTMQEMGEDLVNILDNLRIKYIIGLGDGAGANILARFATMHHTRCLGVVLVNPTGNAATFIEQFKDKMHPKLARIQSTTENYLIMHKYGHKLDDDEQDDEELVKAFEDYKEKLRTAKLNMKNAKVYVDAFMKRDDITGRIKNITDDVLLVCGSKSAYVANMDTMYSFCDKTKTSNLKIDDIGDVLEEAPSKLANSLLLFCKGLGWMISLTAPGIERQRSASQSSTGSGGGLQRRMSMEEYDKPNIRRLSLTGAD
ncbi:hypothetical protein TCAL_12133 [Tigriopus californicus]|uniref:AB hydrolase-1 domain-containing protein n=1 Tax=Tigriopus californicus TaxID=6832 RepID=A0A553PBB9_TIGCA|nr:uncharacterized protein ZK1073.1-like [Tigriopus californicus]TRY74978.1 hypothetical protein TCAL_12133 [Tigriopus californicus]|eukprot:TCALIF_12133-PA protein Name:"Similar to ZK1073.1 Uncharacterized protein ZK1073.1 (Caenorhabditis elegans)" AED:0.05 eAED:0.05 QI:0/0/0/1/1/1/2/0/346